MATQAVCLETWLLVCGTCGRRMESAWSGGKPAYRCHGPLQRLRQVLDIISGSHEASSSPASACSSAMRVSSTRDLMSSLRNTWRRWNATVCVLMNS